MTMFTVHIAADPTPEGQKCSRCGVTLIDAQGAMSLDGVGMRCCPPGNYVGVSGIGSILMDHDAFMHDERACGPVGRVM